MDKEKKIEGMAKVLYGIYCGKDECGKCKQPNCADYHRAELLVNAGYGDVKQAVKEFAEELKEALIEEQKATCSLPSCGYGIAKGIQISLDKIDNRIKQLYGEDI